MTTTDLFLGLIFCTNVSFAVNGTDSYADDAGAKQTSTVRTTESLKGDGRSVMAVLVPSVLGIFILVVTVVFIYNRICRQKKEKAKCENEEYKVTFVSGAEEHSELIQKAGGDNNY